MRFPLAIEVEDFVNEVYQQPKYGTDKARLERLRRAAREDNAGFFGALNAPIAPLRWQARLRLNGTDPVSGRQPFQMPRKGSIVAFRPSLVAVPNQIPGALVPTLDDIDIKIDINQKTNLTSNQGVTTAAVTNETDGNFVVLASWGIQAPSMIDLKLRNPSPTIGFQCRWIRGPGIYQDVIISIVIYARGFGAEISSNVGGEAEGV